MFLNDEQLLGAIEAELQKESDFRSAEEIKNLIANASKVKPFTESQCTEEAKAKRLEKSKKDFFYWDKTYFPPELITDYAAPGAFHKSLISLLNNRDGKAHIVMGPRNHAKTSTIKRKVIYDFLHAKRKFVGFGSGTLRSPKMFLFDVVNFLVRNPRIKHDYSLKWLLSSMEGLALISNASENPEGCYLEPLSEERSTRGGSRNLIDRYDLIVITDLENETSSLTKEAVQKRIDRINEMRQSLESWGTYVAEGNNFAVNTAMNQLIQEEQKGLLSSEFVLHKYPAWNKSKTAKCKSLWPAKYPAKSEDGLKAMLKPADKYDWAGNYQQEPIVRGSDIFPPEFWQEYEQLPRDIKSVLYTDPNLSKKGKGDTTATGALGWSPSAQKYYIISARCKSYSDPNDLIEDTLRIRQSLKNKNIFVCRLGFDGNVSQESHWTSHVRNYSRLNNIPVPPIDYKKYNVDDLTKNAEMIYKRNEVFFPKDFKETKEGKSFYDQFTGFSGKKAGKKDDAADWFICALELLFELHLVSYNRLNDCERVISISRRNLSERL